MEGLVNTIVFCALITQSPYYDCDTMWTMHIIDVDNVPCAKDNKKFVGCTYFDVNIVLIAKRWINSYDSYDNTILWHELKHVRCMCNWHN